LSFLFNYSVIPDVGEIIFAMIILPDITLTYKISALYKLAFGAEVQ